MSIVFQRKEGAASGTDLVLPAQRRHCLAPASVIVSSCQMLLLFAELQLNK